LEFDNAAIEYCQWSAGMPADWDAGTITAVFHWTCAGGQAAETVRWYLQARSMGNDDAIDQGWGAGAFVDDTFIANGDEHVTPATSALTVEGTPAAGERMQFRGYRDVNNDDLTGDARLIQAVITYART